MSYRGFYYDPEVKEFLVEEMLARLAGGATAVEACGELDLNLQTFISWTHQDPALKERYIKAREALVLRIGEDILAIADAPVGMTDSGSTDSGAVQKQKLQVDTRKWLLSKIAPRQYGDKVETTLVGANGGPVQTMTVEFVKAK